MNPTPKLVLIVAVLLAVLIIGVYALTVLFSQNVPSTAIRKPGAGVAISNCSNLTLPNTYINATLYSQYGTWEGSCNGSYAFNVTISGALIPTFTIPAVCCGAGYNSVDIWNATTGNDSCSAGFPGPYPIGISSGNAVNLSKGGYFYCVGWEVSPYSSSTPSSLPQFTITWNTP